MAHLQPKAQERATCSCSSKCSCATRHLYQPPLRVGQSDRANKWFSIYGHWDQAQKNRRQLVETRTGLRETQQALVEDV